MDDRWEAECLVSVEYKARHYLVSGSGQPLKMPQATRMSLNLKCRIEHVNANLRRLSSYE